MTHSALEIPKHLREQIQEGKVVSFLGSGATVGAVHPKQQKPLLKQRLT